MCALYTTVGACCRVRPLYALCSCRSRLTRPLYSTALLLYTPATATRSFRLACSRWGHHSADYVTAWPPQQMAKRTQSELEQLRSVRANKRHKRHFLTKASQLKLVVVGNGAQGSPASLILFTDKGSILVNCGENVQRLCHLFHQRLSRLEEVWVTGADWRNSGGLPGVLLTTVDAGTSAVNIRAPATVRKLFEASSKFVRMRGMSVKFDESTHQEESFACGLQVMTLPLYGACDRKVEQDTCAAEADGASSQCTASPAVTYAFLCRTAPLPGRLNLKRCVELGVTPGPALATLKSGKNVTLSDGRVVHATDVTGRSQPPRSVLVVDVPDESYVDSLSTLLAPGAATSSSSGAAGGAAALATNLQLVVHFAPSHVLASAGYRQWCGQLPPGCRHLVLNAAATGGATSSGVINVGARKVGQQLGILDRQVFPLWAPPPSPAEKGEQQRQGGSSGETGDRCAVDSAISLSQTPSSPQSTTTTAAAAAADTADVVANMCQQQQQQQQPESGAQLNTSSNLSDFDLFAGAKNAGSSIECPDWVVMPRAGGEIALSDTLTYSRRHNLANQPLEDFSEHVLSLTELREPLRQYRAKCDALAASSGATGDIFPQIVFLGTGSSVPNTKRSASGILVRTSDSGCAILDCGEGTLSQMIGLFGTERCDQLLSQLSLIFVSHLHADHHLGLINLLERRRHLLSSSNGSSSGSRCLLVATPVIQPYLTIYHQLVAPILDTVEFVSNEVMLDDDGWHRQQQHQPQQLCADIESVRTCLVNHCEHAYGVRLTVGVAEPAGGGGRVSRTLVYSGDTRPCPALVKLGEGCDVLIHEASFQDELNTEAQMTFHSTWSEAAAVGEMMKARHVILTHFSQRYSTVPYFPEHCRDNVGVAFDNMMVSFNQLGRLPLLIPLLKIVFADHLEELRARLHRKLGKSHA